MRSAWIGEDVCGQEDACFELLLVDVSHLN